MSSEIFINKLKSCAVTGHRILQRDFDKEKVKKVFLKLIDDSYDTFLVGMALGFDTECFLILEEIKKKKNIKIIACIPCESQSKMFTSSQKELYERMINSADSKVILSKEYTPYCMIKRNRFMVDNCTCLVAYLRQEKGGTKNTVEYAKKQNVLVINV